MIVMLCELVTAEVCGCLHWGCPSSAPSWQDQELTRVFLTCLVDPFQFLDWGDIKSLQELSH